MTCNFSGKQTRCQLISVRFTNILGFRGNASISLCCLAPQRCIYISKIHIWRFWTPKLSSLKHLIQESGATPSRCTYSINSAKKHSAISCQSTWFRNWVLDKFITGKYDPDHLASTHLLSAQGCWGGLVPSIPPRIDSKGPSRGLLWLNPPFRRFQMIMACSPRRR
jgi:hypothetical protein